MVKLEKTKTEHERIILQHLEQCQDPGLKYQDIVVFKENRKYYPHRKERDEQLVNLLEKHEIRDPKVVQQIRDLTKTKKMIDHEQFILKVKNL
jgi:hypothetical protein